MAYTAEQFNELVREFAVSETTILNWKAGEYTAGTDRLQNFREISQLTGLDMPHVALIYLLKHMQSISLAVRQGNITAAEWVWEKDGGEGLKQRFADARNYLLLLAACIDEGTLRLNE